MTCLRSWFRQSEAGPASPYASQGGFSPIFITAAISIAALLAVAGWQISTTMRDKNIATSYVADDRSAVNTEDTLASSTFSFDSETTALGSAVLDGIVGEYLSLQERGLYTPEVGEKTAEKMAATLKAPVAYRTYTAADIAASTDTSYARMLAYRGDLQVALAPLLKNTEAEYEIFAYYVSTKDKKNLEKLLSAAQNYRDAAKATARVIPPKDALHQHLGILNAMEEFAATIDVLVANADDPFASVALLRSYNQSETSVLTSFAALAKYYREKQS